MLVDDSHRAHLTYDHGEAHVIFHHPSVDIEHQGSTAKRFAALTTERDGHADHELHISDHSQKTLTPAKTLTAYNAVPGGSVVFFVPKSIHPTPAKYLPRSPPEGNSHLAFLRVTVLLI